MTDAVAFLVGLNSRACLNEIAGLARGESWASEDDAYWFARLAAHFARAACPSLTPEPAPKPMHPPFTGLVMRTTGE